MKKNEIINTEQSSYKILQQLGEGGSGTVYKVKDKQDKLFALKILDSHKSNSDKHKRFRNEIEFCRKVNHRNIVKVIDFGDILIKEKESLFYVMPYYTCTLRDLLEKQKTSDQNHDFFLKHFLELLDALEFTHEQLVFHRDIKPENILYDDINNTVAIADFGVAHFTDDFLVTSMETKGNSRLANFLYSAPEQRSTDKKVDHRADIYAMGLILNEIFTGQVLQGSNYLNIANISPMYSYIDDVVEKMVCQSPEYRISIPEIRELLLNPPTIHEEDLTEEEAQSKKLLLQSIETWVDHGILPSIETFYLINKELSLHSLTLTEMAFLYASSFFKIRQIEDWGHQNQQSISFDYLFYPLKFFSNYLTPIVLASNIKKVNEVDRGIADMSFAYPKYFVSSLVVEYNSIISDALYCFVRDSENEGIEFIVHRNNRIPTRLCHFPEGTARKCETINFIY